MNFCKMCGEPLRSSGPAAALVSPTPANKRGALPSALAAVVGSPSSGSGARRPEKTIVAAGLPRKPQSPPSHTPPAAVAPPPHGRASTSPVAPVLPISPVSAVSATANAKQQRTCPVCAGSTPVGFAFCQHCGVKLDITGPVVLEDPAALSAPSSGNITTVADAGIADTIAGDAEVVPLVKKRLAAVAAPAGRSAHDASPDAAPWGKLVSVLRDGSDGESHPLVDEVIDIGRTDGTLSFDDRFLAGRHARVERRGVQTVLVPLETTNGIYYRLRAGESTVLVDGDHLLLGKEVLRFEIVEPEERAQGVAMQHGVRLFGSPVRSPWARLRQMLQSGLARDLYHLVATEITLGREEGDLRWTDDEFMSRRHARLTNRDGRAEIVDLESSNGTFVRVRGERPLRRGDVVRMGDQLFRFELL